MFIGLLKTVDNQIAREVDTFAEAWSFLQRNSENCSSRIVKAVVLEETEDNYLDDQFPDFEALKEVASMRVIR
jgi:hypothetical protein